MAGKPHPPIYEEALRELARVAGRQIPKNRILAIGDGLGTDALGANRAGFDCLFIASGMHGEALFTGAAPDPNKIESALAGEGAHARYAMGALR
jgi:ribonucleotide monophosphatase NagD (HAD superfamily)